MTGNKLPYLYSFVAVLFVAAFGHELTRSFPDARAASDRQVHSIDQATAGEITGKVIFEGTPPERAKIMMNKDPVCVSEHSEAVYAQDGEVNSNGTLPNVFVFVKKGAERHTIPVPLKPVTLDQIGCTYSPHVLGVMAGQPLRIVSSDPTTHNIHPMPKVNREWNHSQPPGAPALVKKFVHPEIVIPVKCNQHPWMRAYIGVTSNPFYGVTGSNGTFTIRGIPPGDYTLEAWTATFGTQEQNVTLGPKESKTANFIFKAP